MQYAHVSYQSGSDTGSRGNFKRNGYLNLQQDQNRSISDRFTVFAFAYEHLNITATKAPIVWAIGYTTDLATNYTDLSGDPPIYRSPYYKTRYSNDEEMVSTYSTRGEYMSRFPICRAISFELGLPCTRRSIREHAANGLE